MVRKAGRPKAHERDKRELLLEAAGALFKTYGIRKVTIEDVCLKASVSKVTFYKHFKNKAELLISTLRQLSMPLMAEWNELIESHIPFTEKIQKSIELKDRAILELGSAFVEDFLREDDPEVLAFLDRWRGEQLKTQLEFIRRGQREGVINAGFAPEYVLYLMDQINRMSRETALERLFPDVRERTRKILEFLFHGITTGRDHGPSVGRKSKPSKRKNRSKGKRNEPL